MDAPSSIESTELVTASAAGPVGLDLVIIHGVNLPDIALGLSRWKTTLPKLLPENSSVTAFDLRKKVDDTFELSALVGMGRSLLTKLQQLFGSRKVLCLISSSPHQYQGIREMEIVHQKLATTETRAERPTPIDVELPRVFDYPDTMIARDIAKFLSGIMKDALDKIQRIHAWQELSLGSNGQSIASWRISENIALLTKLASGLNSTLSSPSKDTRSPLSSSFQSNIASEPSYVFVTSGPSNFPKTTTVEINLPIYRPSDEFVANPDFQGRVEVLGDVREALSIKSSLSNASAGQTVQAYAICGPGGIGKTQVVRHFAISQKGEFDVMFWLRASDKDVLNQDFLRMAYYLGFDQIGQATDPVIRKEFIWSWLSNPRYNDSTCGIRLAKWLLIFDNADDPGLLTEFWPRQGQGSVLITSRNELKLVTLYFGARGINLDVLLPDEATSLSYRIFQRLQGNINLEQCTQIALKLHCFPLAIVQMAGVCLLRDWSPEDFLKRYENEMERRTLHHQPNSFGHRYLKTLASIWSLHNFEERSKSVLFIFAVLDPDNIREDILTTKPALAKLDIFPTDIIDLKQVLTPLRQASVVVTKSKGILSIHRFVQDVIKAEITGKPKFAVKILLAAMGLILGINRMNAGLNAKASTCMFID
ncbi:MAG: hypothetical protein Q9214_000506 [Letrouitia sp. 1 TL-2023]